MVRILASMFLCALLLPAARAGDGKHLEVGDSAPALQAPQLDGTPLMLQALHGKVVYVDFWASWCAPCREAMPALDALHRQHGGANFSVVAVNVDTDREAAQAMLKRLSVSYPVVFDPAGVWPEAFGLRGMPSGYLLDRTGVIRFIKTGYQAKDLPKLVAAIEAELGRTQ